MTCAKGHNSQLKGPGLEFRSMSKSQVLSIFLRNIFQRNEGRSLLLLSFLVVSDSLWLHRLQQARLPCPSLTPWVCSNSCPLSQWYHPTISSVVPFSPCPQSSPASGSFLMSHLFTSGAKVLKLQLQHQFFQWILKVHILWICNISKNSSFALLNYLWSEIPFYNFQSIDYHPRWEREH